MTQRFNITILSPPGAEFSRAFAEVAETYFHSLRALGYETVLTANHLRPDAMNVVFGLNQFADYGELRLPSNVIIVNLEQFFSGSPWFSASIMGALRTHVVWDYSASNVAALQREGVQDICLVPLGARPEMIRLARCEPSIDVLHYGWLSPRRLMALQAIEKRGLRVKALGPCWGIERDWEIAAAKIILQVRAQEEYRIFEIVRASYLMTNGKAILSERDERTVVEKDIEPGVAWARYEDLAEVAVDLCQDSLARQALEAKARGVMVARPQELFLADALTRFRRP